MHIRAFEQHRPVIHATAYVDSTAVIIGDVEIGQDSAIWPLCVLRGDINRIRIGARTNIQDGTVIHVTHDGPFTPGGYATTIGDEVTVGHRALLHACTIGNLCLIGMGSIVMDGAVVPEHTIIGAGSVVPAGKVLEGGFLYVGSPAKKVRPLNDKELAFLPYSAEYYCALKNRHTACLP